MQNYYEGTGSGGGFVRGSQGSGGRDSPGDSSGNKKNGALRPVTCKQILQTMQKTSDHEVIIDGVAASQIVVVAQVMGLNVQSTNLFISLDDGTGTVEARQWIEQGIGADYESELSRRGIVENAYMRVMGTIKSFGDKRYFNAMVVRPLIDPPQPGAPPTKKNVAPEVFFHLLDALHAKMMLTRGPIGGSNAMTGVQSTNPGASAYQALSANSSARIDQYAGLDPMQKRIVGFISNSAADADGVHVTALTRGLGPNVNAEEVSDALEKLQEAGYIYNTTDEFWYALSS